MPKPSKDDLIVWPDDTWCYAEDLRAMAHKSDDYRRIPFDTLAWGRELARLDPTGSRL